MGHFIRTRIIRNKKKMQEGGGGGGGKNSGKKRKTKKGITGTSVPKKELRRTRENTRNLCVHVKKKTSELEEPTLLWQNGWNTCKEKKRKKKTRKKLGWGTPQNVRDPLKSLEKKARLHNTGAVNLKTRI